MFHIYLKLQSLGTSDPANVILHIQRATIGDLSLTQGNIF